jgi:type IV pilus assembly protein PilM
MPRTIVGLDIGSSGIRAAEFTTGRRPTLRRFASVPLPSGAVRSGAVADVEAVAEALRALWTQGRFGTKIVSLGLANAGVLVRQMDLDWMPPGDFRKALRYQVEDALPMPVDDANLDYHLLEELVVPVEGDEEGRRVSRVLLVAAARDMVDGFVQAVHQAGLRPVRVDIIPFALVRASCRRNLDDSGAAEAIVDIGYDTITVIVHQSGQPQYVRLIPGHGSDEITRALQERYDWTWEDAERTKIRAGLPGHADIDDIEPGTRELDHPAQRVIIVEAETLVAEVRATLDYFRDGTDDPSVLSRVLLTGAGTRLGGLRELLEERLGVPVEPLSVLDRIRKPRRLRLSEDDQGALAIPMGLCTQGSGS